MRTEAVCAPPGKSIKLKKVIISVTTDLVSDQRVKRTAGSLHGKGLDVTLVGRKRKASLPLDQRNYKTIRMRLCWEKGPFFYANYNLRLFFYLLFHKADILVANDLDTLLPNYLVSKIKGATLYYDSHEYFTEMPELVNRKGVQHIWKRIERWILPKLKHVYTVNDSIAKLYEEEYGIKVDVVRNIPDARDSPNKICFKTKKELGLPENKKIILYQGTGINIHRGAEEALEAMQYIEGAILLFIGEGGVVNKLKQMSGKLNLADKVIFIDKLPSEQLKHYTRLADIGLTLDKDTNINYRYSLPNKLFDYIQAGVPVLASSLPEVNKIVKGYDIGLTIDNHDPKHIAGKMKEMFADDTKIVQWKINLQKAANELNWESEEKKLLEIFKEELN